MAKKEQVDISHIEKISSSIIESVSKIFRGKKEIIEYILVALFSGGHVLLEDVPGTGKTILARAISKSLNLPFARIQCTSDLMPADLTGTSIFSPKTQKFRFRKGPLMNSIVLVDELNRATPRTQAALLEAMAEGQISADGKHFPLPNPFFVIATENPVEQEGTFPLPEAQKDRFMLCISPGYPSLEEEKEIIEAQRRITHPVEDVKAIVSEEDIQECKQNIVNIHVESSLLSYLLDLVRLTREDPRIALGVSPRGAVLLYRASQALAAIRGRSWVVPEDIKELVEPVFIKRIILQAEYQARGSSVKEIIKELIETVEVPLASEK